MQSKCCLDSSFWCWYLLLTLRKNVSLLSAAVTAAALLTSKQTLRRQHLRVIVENFDNIQYVSFSTCCGADLYCLAQPVMVPSVPEENIITVTLSGSLSRGQNLLRAEGRAKLYLRLQILFAGCCLLWPLLYSSVYSGGLAPSSREAHFQLSSFPHG